MCWFPGLKVDGVTPSDQIETSMNASSLDLSIVAVGARAFGIKKIHFTVKRSGKTHWPGTSAQ